MHRNYPKRLSESESGKITQHIDAGVDGIGQILGEFQKIHLGHSKKMSISFLKLYKEQFTLQN